MVENSFVIFAYLIFFVGMYMLLGLVRAEKLWHKLAKKSWLLGILSNLAGGEQLHQLHKRLVDKDKKKGDGKDGDIEMEEKGKKEEGGDGEKDAEKEKDSEEEEDEEEEDEEVDIEGDKELRKLIIEDRLGVWIWFRKRFIGRDNHHTGLLMALAAVLIFVYALVYIGKNFFFQLVKFWGKEKERIRN